MRLLIIDPICCQEKGHNLASLYKYSKLFSSSFSEISLHVAKSRLLTKIDYPSYLPKINFDFGLYYLKYIPLPGYEKEEMFQKYLNQVDYVSMQIKSSFEDIVAFFIKYELASNDHLFFPSVDFFSLYSLCLYLLENKQRFEGLTLTLRWIGVMENAANHADYSLSVLLELVKRCKSFVNIILTAESSVYSRNLENELDQYVINTPVPPDHEIIPMDQVTTNFNVVFPGSARPDKGFTITSKIITTYIENYPLDNVKFISQSVPPHEIPSHEMYAKIILSNPNSALYPSDLIYSELLNLFRQSHLICMPYATDIYQFRSSAILTESCGYCRQIVTSSDTGFSDEVNYFGLGKTCSNVDEYCDQIHSYYCMDKQKLFNLAQNSRERFQRFCKSQYASLVSMMLSS